MELQHCQGDIIASNYSTYDKVTVKEKTENTIKIGTLEGKHIIFFSN